MSVNAPPSLLLPAGCSRPGLVLKPSKKVREGGGSDPGRLHTHPRPCSALRGTTYTLGPALLGPCHCPCHPQLQSCQKGQWPCLARAGQGQAGGGSPCGPSKPGGHGLPSRQDQGLLCRRLLIPSWARPQGSCSCRPPAAGAGGTWQPGGEAAPLPRPRDPQPAGPPPAPVGSGHLHPARLRLLQSGSFLHEQRRQAHALPTQT